MREVTDVLKRGHRAAEKGHICFKEFVHAEPQGNNDSEIRKKKDYCHYKGFIEE